MSATHQSGTGQRHSSGRSEDPVAAYVPMARLAIGTAHAHEQWVHPLARLLEAAARGVGHLPAASVVGTGDATPPQHLIAIESDVAMLPRQAAAWRVIRHHVENAADRRALIDDDRIRSALERILPPQVITDTDGDAVFDNVYQRLAVAGLVDAACGVLTGGPGSGKTTTAAALLALRVHLQPDLTAADIVVCAPTGKAANRLALSLRRALERLSLEERERNILEQLRPITIHRTLGWIPTAPEDGGPWRHHRERPLAARIVLVDEASMVDTELMAALVQALPTDAALLLIGDRDQLDAVEAGGVLAELVQRGACGDLPSAHAEHLERRLGHSCVDLWRRGLPHADTHHAAPLPGFAYGLAASFRAKDAPWVLELAALVRPGGSGDATAVRDCCEQQPDTHLQWLTTSEERDARCHAGWRALLAASAAWRAEQPPDSAELQQAIETFQLLVAGNRQVARANDQARRLLAEQAAQRGDTLLHGTPIMIGSNDRGLDLANGDVGILIGHGLGTRAHLACFPGHSKPLPLARLPRFTPAFAITIHKSQGSEWRDVVIDLPPEAGELLDRNLLYTAVTRSSSAIALHAPGRALTAVLG